MRSNGNARLPSLVRSVWRNWLLNALGIERCWCVTLALNDFETLFAGASEQTFEAPGVQSGNPSIPKTQSRVPGFNLRCELPTPPDAKATAASPGSTLASQRTDASSSLTQTFG